MEKRVRSDGKARPARERDEGLITTLEEYLRATVCVFHPRPSFLRSSVRCNASFSSFPAFLFHPASLSRSSSLVQSFYPLTLTTNPNPLVHSALRVFTLQFSIYRPRHHQLWTLPRAFPLSPSQIFPRSRAFHSFGAEISSEIYGHCPRLR